jgi:hypothetical protein
VRALLKGRAQKTEDPTPSRTAPLRAAWLTDCVVAAALAARAALA